MWAIRRATLQLTSWHDSKECMATTSCTLWVGMHLGCPQSNMLCRRALTQRYALPQALAIATGADYFLMCQIATGKNINRFRDQLQKLGFSYDWDR